jgi:DNA-binding CsgD family transcriptional regulator
VAEISGRQRLVLDLLMLGKTNRQIGEELYLSEKTVKNHVSQILTTLGVENRTAAVAEVWRREPTLIGSEAARIAAEQAWDHVADAIRAANPYRA